MAISKSILLGVNRITSITASSESGDFVDDNLLNQQPSELWKASAIPSPAEVTITGAFDRRRAISGIALTNHNLQTETIRLELSTDSGYTDVVYDQTWDVADEYYAWGTGSWGDVEATWGGFALDEQATDSQFIQTFTTQYAAYYRVTLGSLTVTPQAGALFLGEALTAGVSRDPTIPVVDPSTVVMTRGQAMRSDNQPTYREIYIRYVALTASQAHDLRNICRSSGRRKLVVFAMQPGASGVDEVETEMVCRMVDWSGPTRIWESGAGARYTAEITFREAL